MACSLQSVSCVSNYNSTRTICIEQKHNNNDNNSSGSRSKDTKSSNRRNIFTMTKLMFSIWSIMTLGNFVVFANSAAVFSNIDIAKPSFEPLCHSQQEHFIESEGKESSLILEFNSGVLDEKHKSCTRILSAPSNYGFIVRLILPKIRQSGIHHLTDGTEVLEENVNEMPESPINDMTTLIGKLNATAIKPILRRTCPLSVFSSLVPHTAQWRVDPCQLEDTAPEMEDPVRLFQGRVRIVWEHNDHTLNSKLMVTALGKGEQCRAANKHPCLKIGDEPILCISKDLVCDGIRHCPNSNEYDSDEECWKRSRFDGPFPSAMENGLFEHFALEVFRNLFAFDVQNHAEKTPSKSSSKINKSSFDVKYLNVTTLRKVPKKGTNSTDIDGEVPSGPISAKEANDTTPTTGSHRRNSTRNGMHSDLSKYGPWGYLMLGMLLCGGALLICGLWASASQQATANERESALATAAAANGISIDHTSVTSAPPNYEELDPPPAYSVLFPNQKTASNATLNTVGSLQTQNSTTGTTAATPVSPSRPACSNMTGLVLSTTNAQASASTRAQAN